MKLVVATAAAVLLGALTSLPAAAVDGADFLVFKVPSPGARGLAEIRDGQSNTQMIAVLIGLRAERQHRVVLSTKRCDQMHRAADRLAGHSFQSDAAGSAFIDATLADGLAPRVMSLRLFRGTTQIACARGHHYASSSSSGLQPGDQLAVGVWDDTDIVHAMVVIGTGDGNDDVAYAMRRLDPNNAYRLVASSGSCDTPPRRGTRLFRRDFQASAAGTAFTDGAVGDLAQAPESLHLYRRTASGFASVGCQPADHYGAVGG